MENNEERRRDYINVEEHLKTIDAKLELLQEILNNHIKDETDLTPIVKELVDAWRAAGFLANIIKWIGIIAGAIAGAMALIKGHKP